MHEPENFQAENTAVPPPGMICATDVAHSGPGIEEPDYILQDPEILPPANEGELVARDATGPTPPEETDEEAFKRVDAAARAQFVFASNTGKALDLQFERFMEPILEMREIFSRWGGKYEKGKHTDRDTYSRWVLDVCHGAKTASDAALLRKVQRCLEKISLAQTPLELRPQAPPSAKVLKERLRKTMVALMLADELYAALKPEPTILLSLTLTAVGASLRRKSMIGSRAFAVL
jgi:hypothetical protein